MYVQSKSSQTKDVSVLFNSSRLKRSCNDDSLPVLVIEVS